MDKMTSGEIAKKAGISQKAVRLYDEKGLLKPSGYSEGNYRLYDKEALLVLENIITLKQIGFSLEEIRDNLIVESDMDIMQSLNRQLEIMEKKKAEIARMIQLDQSADEGHFHALKHYTDIVDWYVKIYESLNLQEGAKVLDAGCGYGKLWRNSWANIPQNVVVDGIDLHGSWADDLAGYIEEHKEELANGTSISLQWADFEEADIWEALSKETYSNVIAHYLFSFLKNEELFLQRVVEVLAEGGMFSCNEYEVNPVHMYWKRE